MGRMGIQVILGLVVLPLQVTAAELPVSRRGFGQGVAALMALLKTPSIPAEGSTAVARSIPELSPQPQLSIATISQELRAIHQRALRFAEKLKIELPKEAAEINPL